MYVNVTHEEFAHIQRLKQEAEDNSLIVQDIIAFLCLCVLSHGGEFNPQLARMIETELRIVPSSRRDARSMPSRVIIPPQSRLRL